MSAKKFSGATSREVLNKVRQALGDDAVIIANRAVGTGVEVLAVSANALGVGMGMEEAPAAPRPPRQSGVQHAGLPSLVAAQAQPPATVLSATTTAATMAATADAVAVRGILSEIQHMRGVLQAELAAMAVNDLQRRNPVATGLLGELLCAGFSPAIARALTAHLPVGEALELLWRRVSTALEQRMTIAADDDLITQGGVFALVGPTGVGKTTTIAKLAARGVMRYGASGVALLTTDSYRIAAQDQLRIYAKILGVSVHAVKDAENLALLLGDLQDKPLVLIDTIGMSQRDRLVASQSALLAGCRAVRKILLLNATANVATLEEVVSGYAPGEKPSCIITKVDEAAGLAPTIDVCVRHGLMLNYLTNGQRVPEDIHLPNRAYLLHRALRTASKHPALALAPEELPLMMAMPAVPAVAGDSRV